jgi:hypothetical protein
MSQPTYDDVNLLLKLYDLRREAKLREARSWFFANFRCKSMADFGQTCPMGSEANASYRQFVSYWDMVSSFVNMGVLNAELCFTNNRELLLCWERVKPMIGELRKAFGDPNYLGHLEKAGTAYTEWFSKTSGADAYKSFVARVAG